MQQKNILQPHRYASPDSNRVLTIADETGWRAALPTDTSVFGSVEFASIVERFQGHAARLFVYNQDEARIAYPLFLRPVSDLPFAAGRQMLAWDSLSPEYTGPLALRTVTRHIADGFRNRFAEYCRQERIVAEFAHVHPWHSCDRLLEKEDLSFDREIVYVDLTVSGEELWQDSLSPACRKNINRARKEQVRVFQATTPREISEFHRIYIQTMSRRRAQARYNFPLSYFMAFFEQMANNATFFLAEYKNQLVAGTLYLHDKVDVYSYLGGADQDFQHARPTNAVIWEAIRWAQSRGNKRLILGGGYEPDDGIFRFKASFSPRHAPFHVYKHIHLPDEYAALCRAWAAHYLGDYFPTYRLTPVTAEREESDEQKETGPPACDPAGSVKVNRLRDP